MIAGPLAKEAPFIPSGGPGLADEAARRLVRHPAVWIWLGVMWVGVVGMLLAAGYPRSRVGALVAVLLVMQVLVPVAAIRRTGAVEQGRDRASALTAARFATAVLTVALTGGLRSPLALTLFLGFSTGLLADGWSRAVRIGLVAGGVGVLAMALVPARWLGPPVPEPLFTAMVAFAGTISLGLQLWFVTVLRRVAISAVADAIRAREDLAEHALARARELERVGAHLSHELKNPLGATKALVQISRRCATDAATRDRLAVVEGEVDRMTRIVKSHLSFSRPLDRLRLGAVQVGDVVRSVQAALRGRAEAAGVRLHCAGDALVRADVRRLEEALFNLVDNAIEASSRGGAVDVVVAREAETVRVAIRDSGRGMSAQVLERLGTPFFTTREEGTGLGVVLARAVFEQHGGTLEFHSAVGEGTTATGSLPAGAEA